MAAMKVVQKFSCFSNNIHHGLTPVFFTQVRHSRYRAHHLRPLKTLEDLNTPLPASDKRLSKRAEFMAPWSDQVPHFYRDKTLDKLTNLIMMGGRRQIARTLLYKVMEKIKRVQVKAYWETKDESVRATTECDPIVIIKKAIENATPVLYLTPLTRGGITYQVPTPITPYFAKFMAMRWFVRMSRDRTGPGIKPNTDEVMYKEFLAAYKNEGRVIKAKLDLHRTCEQNRAYAYYKIMGTKKGG